MILCIGGESRTGEPLLEDIDGAKVRTMMVTISIDIASSRW